MFTAGAVLVLGGVWVTGLLARGQLTTVRGEIAQLRSQLSNGQLTQAKQTAADIESHAGRAHSLTTGPAWATLAAVPAGGEPFHTVRDITTEADRLGSHVLPSLVDAAGSLDPSTLRTADGGIRAQQIAALAPTLDAARASVQDSTSALRATPSNTWLSPVDRARTSFLDQLTGLDFGPDYNQLLAGARSTSFYLNSDITPQFSYAAQIWIAMWQRRTGQRLDGALAVDPTAITYLLGVTGPAQLPNGQQVTAGNVVSLTQQQVYARFPRLGQQGKRKRYLLQIAQAVARKVVGSGADATALLKAAGTAAGQRRLLVYSTDPATERKLQQTSLSGAIPHTSRPYAGLAIVNVGGNKLDYYLHRQLTWQRTGCGSTREVTVTVRLTNAAPAHGLSPYVTERNDFPGHRTKPGDNRLAVYYYATDGARLDSLDVDG